MESVGQELRRERLLAGLTLEQVSAKTRISLKSLQAIENDDLPQTSSPFFYKSFVRQFAECLNFDYVRLASAVQMAADSMPQPLMPGQVTPGQVGIDLHKIPAIRVRRPKNFRWLSSIASLGMMLVGCSTLYAIWQSAKTDWRGSVQVLVGSIRSEPRIQATPKLKTALQPEIHKPIAQQLQAHAAIPDVHDAESDHAVDSDLTAHAQSPSPADSTSQVQELNQSEVSDALFHVELSAIERTWLSIVEDGKETFSGVLEAAETKMLEGHETARIRTGNAGGLSLTFNGKSIGTIGPRGQIRTVVFTRDNYEVLEPSAHISLTHFDSGLE